MLFQCEPVQHAWQYVEFAYLLRFSSHSSQAQSRALHSSRQQGREGGRLTAALCRQLMPLTQCTLQQLTWQFERQLQACLLMLSHGLCKHVNDCWQQKLICLAQGASARMDQMLFVVNCE